RMPAKVTERSGYWDWDIRSSLFPTQAKALEWATGESCLGLYQITIQVGATVAEELPRLAHFGDHIEIQVGGEDFVAVAGSFGDDLAARVAKVALAVELAYVPGSFAPDAIDGCDEVAVRDGVGRLLEFPEIFAQTGDRC